MANPCNPFLDPQSEHISSSTASGCTCLYCQHCFPVASGTTAHLCLLLSLLFLDFFNLPDFHPVNLLSLSVCLDDILQVFRIFPYRTFLLISSICVKFSRCIPAGRHFRSFTASPTRQRLRFISHQNIRIPAGTLIADKRLSIYERMNPSCYFQSGSHLLSHAVSSIVSSAVRGLTIVFGMGTCVSPVRIGTSNFALSSCKCADGKS